jgi:hypothetical protein
MSRIELLLKKVEGLLPNYMDEVINLKTYARSVREYGHIPI